MRSHRTLLLICRYAVFNVLLDPIASAFVAPYHRLKRVVGREDSLLRRPIHSKISRARYLSARRVEDIEIDDTIAHVALVAGEGTSGYGRTSPEPDPEWSVVAAQLARRLRNFAGETPGGDDMIAAESFEASRLSAHDLEGFDIVVALGVSSPSEESALSSALDTASHSVKGVLADQTCGKRTLQRRVAGDFAVSSSSKQIIAKLIPWSKAATGMRLLGKTETLLARKSSEDYIFAVLFMVHGLVRSLDVVKSDVNPSWEKGILRNAAEFKKMSDCCGPEIYNAVTDTQTKKAIDLLNSVDLRDQVGSYRVIVSNETPELEEFTLCILQQNNCFGCDAPILERPRVPLLDTWRGSPLTAESAREIFIGHLDHPAANPACSQKKPWSWKIVVGANPAYDAFPMQHQIFYPVGDSGTSKSLWYDPVFCVETLDGPNVWCKRHYRCTPRRHWSDKSEGSSPTPGAWTLNTLDNGMVSEEKWTAVDAADDLSWCILHYSGAARRAGQSYVGALLCSPDGQWPSSARSGVGLERIRAAFRKCDLELWELFGGSTESSYMWSEKFTDWAKENPPPLDRIGDMSITAWRKKEREKAFAFKGQEMFS